MVRCSGLNAEARFCAAEGRAVVVSPFAIGGSALLCFVGVGVGGGL